MSVRIDFKINILFNNVVLYNLIPGFTGSMKCDPAAEKYKTKFKKNKDDLVSVLFILFNKEVFDNKVNLISSQKSIVIFVVLFIYFYFFIKNSY